MSGSKRARSTPSITNNTKIFGIMGGTVSLTGRRDSIVHHLKRKATNFNPIPSAPTAGFEYMLSRNLLSRNPLCSGGVGRTSGGGWFQACRYSQRANNSSPNNN
ncbi:MAG: hypothetical protein WD512_13530 [Candidatus Paceibacterota bacterium]